MNLLILEQSNLESGMLLGVNGSRAQHLLETLKVKPGDRLHLGELNGRIGLGFVETVEDQTLQIRVAELYAATPLPPLDLIVAVPRPQMLKRILQTAATFGVRKLFLCGALRSQKSYLQSPVLSAAQLRENLILGLEQGMGTLLPDVSIHKNIHEVLKFTASDANLKLIAHPKCESGLHQQLPRMSAGQLVTLAIGPEAGWEASELAACENAGFANFSLGHRILRVETAVTAALAQVAMLRELSVETPR